MGRTCLIILESTMAKLHDFYKETVVAELAKQFGYKSVMQVPRIEKITLNMGLGEAVADKKVLENAQADMTAIAGQKPIVTVARKSVAGFKIREGYPIGCKVTLRGERMWEFLERLVSIAIPRVRDFRGLNPKSLTVVVTTAWACVNKSSSLKSISIKWIRFVVWILLSLPVPKLMTKHVLC